MFQALAKVGSLTLVSRILGFVRDLVLARVFGAGPLTDAFFVAFKIPNFLRRLFAEGAFSVAFVPILSEYKQQRSPAELKGFVDRVAGTLGAVLLVLTLLGILGAPVLVLLFAPGFSGQEGLSELTADMLRLTFPYLLFISLTAFAAGILNAFGRFAVPAFTPVLLNLFLIAAALWLAPQLEQPIMALAWAVLGAGIAQFLFQLPFLRPLGLLPRFRFAPRDPGVRRVGGLMLPALFGVSVTQLNLLLSTLVASFLQAGSISWLYYADRLMELPVGVLGVALGTVILPQLSQRHADASPEVFSRTIDWGLRVTLLLGIPCAVGLLVLAGPIISTLFQSGQFTAHDVAMTSYGLMAYSVGLMAFLLVKVLAPGFYARQDTRTPVRFATIAVAANILLMALLVWPLQHTGLALATSLAACLNAGQLYLGLRRQGVYIPQPGWGRLWGAMLGGAGGLALVLWLAMGEMGTWLTLPGGEKALRLAGLILLGGGVYGALLLAAGVRLGHFRAGYRGAHAGSTPP
jgi:putative peptidoglycan lipid II flippase